MHITTVFNTHKRTPTCKTHKLTRTKMILYITWTHDFKTRFFNLNNAHSEADPYNIQKKSRTIIKSRTLNKCTSWKSTRQKITHGEIFASDGKTRYMPNLSILQLSKYMTANVSMIVLQLIGTLWNTAESFQIRPWTLMLGFRSMIFHVGFVAMFSVSNTLITAA